MPADGIRGRGLLVSKDAWADTSQLEHPRLTLTKDVNIYHEYGGPDTVGALRYKSSGHIRPEGGTLSFWMKPVNWQSKVTDQFLVNLGTYPALGLLYSPYWCLDTFQIFVDNEHYVRAPGYEGPYMTKRQGQWEHIIMSWTKNMMAWWQNGILISRRQQDVIPLGEPRYALAFGDGTDTTTIYDELLVLNGPVDDEQARALYYRVARQEYGGLLSLGLDGGNEVTLRGWLDDVLGLTNDDPGSVQVTIEGDSLVVIFTCPHSREYMANREKYVGQPLRHDAGKDDPAIFMDDYVQVSLQPGEKGAVYRFVTNGIGRRYEDRDGQVEFEANWQVTSDIRDDAWIVRMEIPLNACGADVAVGDTWGINFAHGAAHTADFKSIWAFGRRHVPDMGTVRFVARAPSITVNEFLNPADGQVSVAGTLSGHVDGVYDIRAEVSTTCNAQINPDDAVFAKLDPKAPEGWQQTHRLDVHAGGSQDFSFSNALANTLAADAVLTVSDDKGGVWYCQRRPFVYSVPWGVGIRNLPSLGKLIAMLDVGAAGNSAGLSVTLAVKDHSGKELLVNRPAVGTQSRLTHEIDITSLAPGTYDLVTTFSRAGQKDYTIERTFVLPEKQVWQTSRAGISDKVPAPWTPLVHTDGVLQCWGRSYDVTANLLPRQVRSDDVDMLAGPIRVMVGRMGKNVPVDKAEVHVKKTSPRRVEWTASGSRLGVTVRSRCWLEFDGFMWVQMDVESKEGLDYLAVELPFDKDVAKLWFSGQYAPGNNPTGRLPNTVYQSKPRNNIIVGDGERGLQICYETQAGWSLNNRNQALELVPGKDSYTVRLRFVDHQVDSKSPRTIAFGLQALPIRPANQSDIRHIWWGGWPGVYHADPNFPKPASPDMSVSFPAGYETWPMKAHHNYPRMTEQHLQWVKNKTANQLQRYNHFFAYKNFDVSTDACTEEYSIYGEEWRAWPQPAPDEDVCDAGSGRRKWTSTCYGADSYLDFYLYYVREYTRYLSDGGRLPVIIYIDCHGPTHCANPYHGHGWVDESGNRRSTYTILSQRRYMQRLYEIFNELGDNAYITAHMSGSPLMAVWGYADLMLSGEQYAAFFNREQARMTAAGETNPASYIPYMSMDHFRAEYTPAWYGVSTGWLTQLYCLRSQSDTELLIEGRKKFGRQAADADPKWNVLLRDEWMRGRHHFTALCLVHDCVPWGGVQEVLSTLRTRFKWDKDVTFHGYWQNQDVCQVKVKDPVHQVVSLANRPERLLVMAFNNTDEPADMQVWLDMDGLGHGDLADSEGVDIMTGEQIRFRDGRANISAGARRIRLICVGPMWDWQPASSENTGP